MSWPGGWGSAAGGGAASATIVESTTGTLVTTNGTEDIEITVPSAYGVITYAQLDRAGDPVSDIDSAVVSVHDRAPSDLAALTCCVPFGGQTFGGFTPVSLPVAGLKGAHSVVGVASLNGAAMTYFSASGTKIWARVTNRDAANEGKLKVTFHLLEVTA